jgi:drug/metabolite transporter, DME family
VRLAFGGLLLLAWKRPTLRWPAVPLVLAVAAMAAYQPLFFSGIDRAGVAVVGIGASPIAGGVLGRWLRRERLGPWWWAATALGLAGAALLATAGGDDAGDDLALGLVLAAGAGVAYAVYVAASASLLDVAGARPDDVAAVVLGLAGAVLVPLALTTDLGWTSDGGGIALAAWLGVVTVAVAYPLLTRGLDAVGVGATATLTLAEPATAALLGLVVLGEDLPARGWFGLVLVAAGVVMATTARRAGPVA